MEACFTFIMFSSDATSPSIGNRNDPFVFQLVDTMNLAFIVLRNSGAQFTATIGLHMSSVVT